jgi:uncharacterized delta-60 repeat protein
MTSTESRRGPLAATLAALGLLLALGPAAGSAFGAAGELDTSFSGDGKATIDLPGCCNLPTVVALQPDGKILVAGDGGGSEDFEVVRFNPDGSIDTSFGSGGIATIDFAGASDYGGLGGEGLAVQADGKVVLVGHTNDGEGNGSMAVARLTVFGDPDKSFGGGDGQVEIDESAAFGGAGEAASEVAIQPDGKILVAGTTELSPEAKPSDFGVARLSPVDGSLDTSFNAGGPLPGFSTVGFGDTDNASSSVLQPDGSLVVAGRTGGPTTGNFAFTRLTPTGVVDASFGLGGKTTIDLGANEEIYDEALGPDGSILGVGLASGLGDFALERLSKGGLPDPSFSGDGLASVDFGGNDSALGVAVQPDGKAVVVGASFVSGFPVDMAVARVGADGSLDPSFGAGGKTAVDTAPLEAASDVALQPDGKIVVIGGGADFSVVRLLGDPAPPAPAAGPAATIKPKCAGKTATIVGTSGKDRLKGTKRKDVIAVLGGNDKVDAGGGDDIVCAGAGKDKVTGGGGKDKLLGEGGVDELLGGGGADKLIGGPGKDKLSGGPGKDSSKQ